MRVSSSLYKYHELVVNAINELDFFLKLDSERKAKAWELAEKLGWQSARPTTIAITIIKLVKPELQFTEIRRFCNVNVQTLRPWIDRCGRKLHFERAHIMRVMECESS